MDALIKQFETHCDLNAGKVGNRVTIDLFGDKPDDQVLKHIRRSSK
jgi:hypothetical protein